MIRLPSQDPHIDGSVGVGEAVALLAASVKRVIPCPRINAARTRGTGSYPASATMRQSSDRSAAMGLIRNPSHLLLDARFMSAPSASRPNSTHVPQRATLNGSGDISWPAPPRTTNAAAIQNAP